MGRKKKHKKVNTAISRPESDGNMQVTSYHACACCGQLTIEDNGGRGQICPVCGWEDDPVQNADPGFAGGANHMSLNEAREKIGMLPRETEDMDRGHIYG